MYYNQPVYSYQEYEQSIAESLLRSELAGKPRPPTQPLRMTWLTLRTDLATLLDRIERRLQPAEEGYLA